MEGVARGADGWMTCTAADLMTTDLVTVTEDESVPSAWELLSRGGFHHLPVVRGRLCVGVLDDRTVARAWLPGSFDRSRRRIRDILPAATVVVSPGTTVPEIARVMREQNVDVVAVTHPSGALIGLVTTTDLVAAVATAAPRFKKR